MVWMTPRPVQVDAVLFDLDGTLVETNIDFPLMKRTVTALALESGLSSDGLQGLDILGIVNRTQAHVAQAQGSEAGLGAREKSLDALEAIEMERASVATEIPGAREAISRLRARGIKVGIVTRNCRRASVASMQRCAISSDVLVTREDTVRHKPEPDQILLAMRKLGVEPGKCVVVGDHRIDILGGKRAGAYTIAFLRDGVAEDFFASSEPDVTVRSLREASCAIIDCDS
jgi:phosphoglycolate phosphatase